MKTTQLNNTRFYACNGSKLTEIAAPLCKDCKFYEAIYVKQSNGSYKPLDLGLCSKDGRRGCAYNITFRTGLTDPKPCKDFVPLDDSQYQLVWMPKA